MIKLVNLRDEIERDVEFGTCELCSYTSDLEKQFYVFQDDTGKTREIEIGEWDWDSYRNVYGVKNVFRFADFVREEGKNLNFDDFEGKDYSWVCKGYILSFEKWFSSVYSKYNDMIHREMFGEVK